jgi:plasmid stabilization system protein ParE
VRLDWSRRALADRERIYAYYWNVASERVADAAEEAIVGRARAIARLNLVYRQGKGGTRECIMRRFPFIIVYRIDPGKLRIVRVLHQAREYFNR